MTSITSMEMATVRRTFSDRTAVGRHDRGDGSVIARAFIGRPPLC